MEALPAFLAGLVVLAGSAVLAQDAPPAKPPAAKALDEKTFAKQFAALTDVGDSGKWGDEKKALRRLLDEAGDQPWVRARRTEIVDEMRRASIRAAVPQPDPATLIQGKLVRWDRKSGDLTVSYGPGQWDDFVKSGKFLIHPAVFDEVVNVKFDGDKFDWEGSGLLNVLVGMHDDELVVVAIGARKDDKSGGAYYPAVTEFVRYVGSKRTVLETYARAPNYGNHYELEIAIGTGEIAVNANGTRLGSAKRPPGSHGRIGFSSKGPFKHLTLRGRASTAWLQGKMDAATHDVEAKFLAKWKVDDELPPWLASGTTPATPSDAAAAAEAAAPPRALPWKTNEAEAILVAAFEEEFGRNHPERVLEHLKKLPPSALPPDVRDYYRLRAHAERGSLSEVADLLDAFCKRNPDLADGRYFHACLLMERSAYDDAAREFAALRGRYEPTDELLRRRVVVDLLRAKPEEAQQALREARGGGAASPVLDALEQMVLHVLRGPNFTRRFEQESPHFTVATDLDNDTARASLKVLEESYAICEQVFGRSEGAAIRFPVYLFSGQTGYIEFAGANSKLSHSTAGMYSPLFKHLLIWNLPDRAEISRTLRHEATHQYLDLLGYHVPVWFNEGLATYVEYIASSSKSDVKGGTVNGPMVRELVEHRAEAIPLAKFIQYGPSSFYDHAAIAYPEAWAFVHFLRHASTLDGTGTSGTGKPSAADAAPEEIHRRLIAALKEKVAPSEVVRRAFEGVDLARLQESYWEHVQRMEASVPSK